LAREHVKAMMGQRSKTPSAANHFLGMLRILMRFAIDAGMRKDDPTIGIKKVKARSEGFHTWTEDEIAAFEAAWPIGTRARLAFGLLLYTAQRRSDVVRMGRQHVHAGNIEVRQQKTGRPLLIPLHH
jgi:integrase